MSWPLAAYGLLGLALAAGLGWYERSRPDARVVALVGTLAAFAALGRIAFAAVPNVKPTTDIVLVAGFALGAGPGFAIGAIAGLASNFFFGQGPWTPWQMAAWGATGLLGALLARACRIRRRGGTEPAIGRWSLALVCGVVGFGFTAVQDVGDWVTYSDHGLPALGAYVGSGLGFDAIHAAGCVAFALLLGPALLRSIQRFARRIEVTWLPAEGVDRFVGVALLIAVALSLSVGGSVSTARAATGSGGAAARAARYLEHAQNRDGGLGAAPGAGSAQLFSGWGALGLASAGVSPGGVRAAPGGATLLAYIGRGAGTHDVGSLERTILVARAAGVPATGFGGRDLVAELVRRFGAHGSVGGQVNLTAFGLLALRGAATPSTAALRARAARWLVSQQDRDGGYGFAGRGGESDADDTGAVLEALGSVDSVGSDARSREVVPVVRVSGVVAARRRAVAYLRRDEDRDGGFPAGPGEGSNAQSTAWAVQGLIAAGVEPETVRRAGHGPLGYLRSLVSPAGAVRYARGDAQTPVWVTGEALLALTATPLPLVTAAAPSSVGSAGEPAGSATTQTAPTPTTATETTASTTVSARTTAAAPPAPQPTPARPTSARGSGVSRAVTRMEVMVTTLPPAVIAGARVR